MRGVLLAPSWECLRPWDPALVQFRLPLLSLLLLTSVGLPAFLHRALPSAVVEDTTSQVFLGAWLTNAMADMRRRVRSSP
jgi:hypothetical protein